MGISAERREADHAPSSFNQRQPEKRLQLAQARGERRLRDEAGIRGLSEMAEAPKRDQILELFDGR